MNVCVCIYIYIDMTGNPSGLAESRMGVAVAQ